MTNLTWLDAPDGPGFFWAGRPGESADVLEFYYDGGELVEDDSIYSIAEMRARGFRFARYSPPVVPAREEPTP